MWKVIHNKPRVDGSKGMDINERGIKTFEEKHNKAETF